MPNYIYFIVIIMIIFIIPEAARMVVILGGLGIAVFLYLFNMMNEPEIEGIGKSNNLKNNLDNSNNLNELNELKNINNSNNLDIKPTYLQYINELLNEPDNIQGIKRYYSKPKYEEQFADYGLAIKQKELLRHSDRARDSEARFQPHKFAPYFGDETDILYDWAWYGVDY